MVGEVMTEWCQARGAGAESGRRAAVGARRFDPRPGPAASGARAGEPANAYDGRVPNLRPSRNGLIRSVPVLGAFVVGAIAYAPLYCFPFLAPQFEETFHASRELGQMPWTMFLLVSAISSPLLGRAYDVFDDRILLLVGSLLIAAGWAMASAATDVAFLIVAYGALLAIGLQLVFVGVTTAIARRYAGVAGLALGVAYAGPGIGVALALPIAAGVIPDLGWRNVSLVFAALSLVALPFVFLMTTGKAVLVPAAGPARPAAGTPEPRPAERHAETGTGLHETSAPGAIAASLEHAPPGSRATAEGLRRTLRTRRFLVLLVGAVGIGAIDEGIFQTSSRHLINQGVGSDFAATLLALQSYAYVAGQVLGGGLSDRFGRRYIGLVCAALIAVGATAIFLSSGSALALAVAGNALYGFGIGATIAIRSAAFSDVFGGHNFGAIFGIIAIAYPAGGIIVMNAGGILYDRYGTYWPVYGIVMVSLLAWTIALVVAGPRRHGLRNRLAGVRARLPV
jgi:MFS family permease